MPTSYDDVGTGDEVVVLLHGHPFDRGMWAPQLTSLAAHVRVVAPDLLGYGHSQAPPVRVRTMRELAEGALRVMDGLGVERFTAVGLSMGGLVAMELALHHPERVSRVVLAATTAATADAAEVREREERADELEREGLLPLSLDMAGKLFGPAARRDPGLVADVIAMMLHAPPGGAAAALRGRARRPPYTELLGGLAMPVLVIAGDQDPYAPEAVVTELVGALPTPEVVRLRGAGHLPNLEQPEQFDAAVLTFVVGAA